ncbi:hypothetical protein CONPUDRAFT_162170 [Coniophora puteana RWD-64-598 SS2]|uniref:CSN8/PSMD8/EIF3K domain-containing protein n=1 Tax=Coniophora puteana (strain RWD-64-598) TaxID=741705 RepID=A0A5M3N1R3_CONPW|nr:uncharacterized protein CONPUDRAFT_162170 [Coniophora puteana RWD-64-598 SS2]EIW84845.1 hypothetical protein CONPUDRAFT_162170 [Coniophora puteana RWD-64-598 SS2]
MMQGGPPTPPPTSATEQLDAARDAALAGVASPQPATAAPGPPAATEGAPAVSQAQAGPAPAGAQGDVYQRTFPQIAALVSQGKYSEAAYVAEVTDLNVEGDASPSRLLVIAPLVLSYLIIDDLTPAHHALMRLPKLPSTALVSHPLTQALMRLLASTLERKYENIYARAQEIFLLSQQGHLADPNLAQLVASMSQTFVESFQQRTFTLLSKAFTSIPLSEAQAYLGMQQDQLLSIANAQGWKFDSATQILQPTAPTQIGTSAGSQGSSSLGTFGVVANGLSRLMTEA